MTRGCVSIQQLEAYEREWLVARGWHRRGPIWIAPEGRSYVDVSNQDTAVHLEKQHVRMLQRRSEGVSR